MFYFHILSALIATTMPSMNICVYIYIYIYMYAYIYIYKILQNEMKSSASVQILI